jgi:glycogen operon protein
VRRRQRRNLLATMILSQGLPMLSAGDELCRTQLGNNNAYCQDNPLNWIDWQNTSAEAEQQLAFTRRLMAFKQAEPWIWQPVYVHESQDPAGPVIFWFNRDGEIMQPVHWGQHQTRSLGYLVGEAALGAPRRMLALFNAGPAPLDFKLPYREDLRRWTLVLDTSFESGLPPGTHHEIRGHYPMLAHSTVILLAVATPVENQAQESLL